VTAENTVLDITVLDNTGEAGAEALAPRVGLITGLRQTFSLSWRTLVQIKHNPFELMDFSVQPVMFLLLFTYVFGGAIGGSPEAYLMFALPGIIVQNSLFTTLNTATGLSTDLEKGFFDRLRSLPIARFAPLADRIVADLAKQAWAVVMLLAIGVIMGFRVGTGPLGVLAAAGLVLVCTLAIAWAMVLVALLAASPSLAPSATRWSSGTERSGVPLIPTLAPSSSAARSGRFSRRARSASPARASAITGASPASRAVARAWACQPRAASRSPWAPSR